VKRIDAVGAHLGSFQDAAMSISETGTAGRYRPYFEKALARAEAEPDAVVVSDRERALSAREFAGLVYRLARALEASGLGRGARVAILAVTSPEALAVRYAAGLLGCATSFIPNRGSDEYLHAFLAHVGPDVLVVFPETAAAAPAAIARGLVPSALSLGPVAGIEVDLLAAAGSMPSDPIAGRADPDDLWALISSGGTTGKSKASRRSFAAYDRMIDVGPTPHRRQLVCSPLAYVSQVLTDQVIAGGGLVVFRDRFDPAEVLRTIEAERITHLGLVEPGLVELIDHPDLPQRDLSSLVAITHIGADAPSNLRRRLLGRIGPVLAHPYGASEAGIVSMLAAPEYDLSHPELLETAGRPLPGVKVRIVNEDGWDAPPGDDGEIVVRSAAAADGYDVTPARSGFQNGEYHTGDLGLIDELGYLHVRGRAQDARVIDDHKVMPLDVANALCAHPDVRYAVAAPMGAQDAGFGAMAVTVPETSVTAGDLRSYVAAAHGAHVAPGVIALVQRIPTTEQGKPDRSRIIPALAAASSTG
jgi:fatty-acyl-CoA synthase